MFNVKSKFYKVKYTQSLYLFYDNNWLKIYYFDLFEYFLEEKKNKNLYLNFRVELIGQTSNQKHGLYVKWLNG